MVNLKKIKNFLPYLRQGIIYSLIILIIDVGITLIIYFKTPLIIPGFLSFLLLVESGIGLTLGGALDVVSSASVHKVLEQASRSKDGEPWSIQKYKGRQKSVNTVLVTSAIVFLMGLVISLFT